MNQLALALLTTLSLAKIAKRDVLSGNVDISTSGTGKRNVTGTIDASFDISKIGFTQDGSSSVIGTFTQSTLSSNSGKQLLVRSRNQKHGARFILNVQGIPFIRAGTWNKNGNDFDGESFRVALLRLVEVLPANETAVTSRNFIRLVGQQWSAINVQQSVIAGVTVTQFSSSLFVRGCNITLKGMISDQVSQSTSGNATTTLTPMRFKYGIEVDNFPFQHGGSLELVKSVRSKHSEFIKSNNTVITDSGTFEWTGNVIVDGKTVAVSSTTVDGDTSVVLSASDNSGGEDPYQNTDNGVENLYAFSLGSGASIYWDPSLNLEAQSAQQSSSASSLEIGITMVVGALLMF